MTTTTATAKQVSYIQALEAKSGHSWTEYVAAPAGARVEQMPKAIASKVIGALQAELPKTATPARTYTSRCYTCGAEYPYCDGRNCDGN